MIRRAILTDTPPDGDDILRPTGLSWNICRSTGQGAAMRLSAGERDKTAARAAAGE